MFKAHDERQLDEKRDEIMLHFFEAEVIANRVGYIFTDKKKRRSSQLLQPWDMFPELFKEQKEQARQIEDERALAAHKQQMAAYAARWNARKDKDNG